MSLRQGSTGVDAPCQPPGSAVGNLVGVWSCPGWGRGGDRCWASRLFSGQMFEQPEVLTGTKARINNQTYPGVCPHTFKYSSTCFKWNLNTEHDLDGHVGTLGPASGTDFELSD